ncbi:HNHc domain-containing protein [Mycena indigotica]|uniref:HNHc domain-containing protein n=1 Tax=Mycena indigotica TaxID=2126181 RepID=A0A8H6TFP1_9AGAR|nr:HNHc domain-containing protein [Mycena indigotica]KAF7316399.1 HNHc domain-containing protein [Mycena indigotica]
MGTLVSVLIDEAQAKDDKASSSGVHDLRNIITLESSAHNLFEKLRMTFEPVPDSENTYNIKFMHAYHILPTAKQTITFENWAPTHKIAHANTKLPLPDPRLLSLHCACAHVAHLSGAGEMLDRVLDRDDYEDIGVLAEDGGSMDVLLSALIPLVAARA